MKLDAAVRSLFLTEFVQAFFLGAMMQTRWAYLFH